MPGVGIGATAANISVFAGRIPAERADELDSMGRSSKATTAPPKKTEQAVREVCTGENARRTIELPVIAEPGKPPPLRKSKAGPRRAAVLIGIHVLFLLHLLHWRSAGRTVTPVEPSEAMETFRDGGINAGFIFFGLTIAATLVLGRFFCGWGCHLVALQDLTLWFLKKLKLRPKAFRSRLLLFVPLLAAIYMFVLPLLNRLYVKHVVGAHVPPFSLHLTRTGFWDTFPGLTVALLTFLFCTVFMVYLLGPKAFCTYACPYGAAFVLSDKVARGRIRVTDACQQCGHCTATCTSNVSVAEEVKRYGMVVDPGCMKTFDCISVCPNDALFFGFSQAVDRPKPPEPAKPRRWDLTWPEEIVAALIFAAFFFTYRGIYGGAIPFLFALGVAGIGTYVSMQAIHLVRRRDLAMQRIRLKTAGRITGMGVAFLITFAGLIALTVHSAMWQTHRLFAERAFDACPGDSLGWQYEPDYFSGVSPEQREAAMRGLNHVDWCQKWGILPAHDLHTQAAWMALTAGQPDRATAHLREAIRIKPDIVDLHLHLAAVETQRQRYADADAAYGDAIRLESRDREALEAKTGPTLHPASGRVWLNWAMYLERRGRAAEAGDAYNKAVRYAPDLAGAWAALGEFQLRSGRADDARRSLLHAMSLQAHDNHIALSLMMAGRTDAQDFKTAVDEYRAAIQQHGDNAVLHANLGYALSALREGRAAVNAYRDAIRLNPGSPEIQAEFGAVLLTIGDLPGAVRVYEVVNQLLPNNAEAAMKLAILYEEAGRRAEAIKSYGVAARGDNPQIRAMAEEAIGRLTAPAAPDR